jgi:anti-repressor protein
MNQRIIANELLPVYETDSGEKVVNGRDLHEFLAVSSKFADWIKNRITRYGFEEDSDYAAVSKVLETGGRTLEYILKLDMAKELCMVENNEQGSRARKYFIEVDKRFRRQIVDVGQLSPELRLARQTLEILERQQIEQAEVRRLVESQGSTIATIQETFLKRDEDWRNKINGMLRAAARRAGGHYREMRNDTYNRLEERAHCDLDKRLRNLRARLQESGATKSRVEETNRMDVIEAEPRLREIYTTIVKEFAIGTIGGNGS